MRRVPTQQLRTGDRIGRDVLTASHDIPLLRAGIRVSDSYRESLMRSNITSVWVDDGLSEGIKPLEIMGERTKQRATAAIHSAFRDVSRSLVSGTPVTSEALREMEEVADLICADVSANVHSALALNDLANADGYTLKHSLAVTALGLSLGLRVMQKYGWIDTHGYRRFDGIDERLSTLGVGLLLHDIGKLAVPAEILEKAGPLSAEEWLAMRAHPTLGAQMLQHADGISPVSRAVGRLRLPGGIGGARDPSVRAHRLGGGRLRRADVGSLVSPRAADARRVRLHRQPHGPRVRSRSRRDLRGVGRPSSAGDGRRAVRRSLRHRHGGAARVGDPAGRASRAGCGGHAGRRKRNRSLAREGDHDCLDGLRSVRVRERGDTDCADLAARPEPH